MATATRHSKACGFGRRDVNRKHGGGAILCYRDGDGSEYYHLTARSHAHAARLIECMQWEAFRARGPGYEFAHEAFYNARAKRVEYAILMNC